MKLIYATDAHLKGRNPARRLDNYPSEILMLFDELRIMARHHGATAVLLGGDVFDTPKISQKLFNKLSRVLKKFPCPIYVVPGNHDIFGQNTDTLEDTMLGSLEATGVVTLLTRDFGTELLTENGMTVALYGQEYTEELDQGNVNDYDITPNSTANFHILMTHGMLVDRPFIGKHTLIKDVVSRADVVLGAHYHPGWDIIEANGVIFCHPGAMARLEGTKTEATRAVQYAVIDIEPAGIEIDLYPFNNARPGKDILDITTTTAVNQHRATLDVFRQTVDDASKFESVDVHGILADIVTAENLGNGNTHLAALLAMTEAEKALDELNSDLKAFVEVPGEVFINRIVLENFQGHEKTAFDLTNGLNALTGPSDAGKTAIIRGIRLALYNEPKGSDFIRHGATSASVQLHFTYVATGEEYVLERSRTRMGSGGYYLYKIDSQGKKQAIHKFTGFGNTIPIEVMNMHQMPKTQLSKDLNVSLNVSYQLDGPFLLNDPASTRAAVIGRLTGVHLVDTAIQSVSKTVVNLQRDIKSTTKLADEINERLLNDFGDIIPLENTANEVELLIVAGQQAEKKREDYDRIRTGYKQTTTEIKTAAAGLVKLGPQIKAFEQLPVLEDLVRVRANMLDTKKDIDTAAQEIADADIKLIAYQKLDGMPNALLDLNDNIARHKEFTELRGKLQKEDRWLTNLDAGLAQLPDISVENILKLEELMSRRRKLTTLRYNINHQVEEIATAESFIFQFEQQIVQKQDEYKQLLKEAGKCPVCYTPISDNIIDKISL